MNILTGTRRPSAAPDLLETALDSLAEGVLVFDAEDQLAYWNSRLGEVAPGFADLLQAGLTLDEVNSRLDGFDSSRLLHHMRRGRNGALVLTVRPLEEGITRERELRRSEKRWRDIAEGFSEWIWESDPFGRVTYVSDEEKAGEDLILTLGRVLSEAKGKPFHNVRAFVRQHDEQRSYHLSGKPVFDAEGRLTGYLGACQDVTIQFQKRHKSYQRLVDTIENLSHGVALWDCNDRLILCNERFRTSFTGGAGVLVEGIAFEDAVRRMAESILHSPEDITQWVEERLDCHRLGLTHERHYPDGRWFLIKDMRLQDFSIVTTRTEITELKRREQAVRQSEARFRAIFQNAAIGVAVVMPGGRIAQANQALAQMLGYSAFELSNLDYSTLIHPEHLEEEASHARRLIRGEIDQFGLESRYLRKDGSAFWVRLTVSIVRGDGVERFGIVMIDDIDNRKRAATELSTFRAVVEASAEAIAILAPDGRPIYVNPAHSQLFGGTLEEAVRIGYRQHYSEDSQQVISREVVPALRKGDSWEGVLEARDGGGRTFPLWQRAGVVKTPKGRPQCFFAFMHDHSSQQQIQDELFKAKEAAEEANVAKTRFLAAASHDLRQPLQALSMFVAVLSNRSHSPEDVNLIKRIEDSVNAVESLLNGLLDVSKLEAGLVVPVLNAFNLGPMMERLAAEFEPLIDQAGLHLRVVRSRAVVRSDPALLERILRNLLNNAVRYTPHGTILLGCRRRGNKLRVEVCDTGIGIPKSQLKAIFREFHQLGNPGRDRRQGLGLGLAIVERLSDLLGHHIEVSSVPGKGSVFAVELPMAISPENAAVPRQLNLSMGLKGATIAVVEDEPDVLESMRLLLESWGYCVVPGRDCDEVLYRLSKIGRAPDLILADYRLQNSATGAQAIGRIRQRMKSPTIPAVILTGDTAPERLRQAQAGGHGLLHKPVQPAALRQTIDELLTRVARA